MDKRNTASKKKIKDAFITVHSKEGFYGVTISSVCKEAGISRGAFYSNYRNVTEVLDEILDEALEGTWKFWERQMISETDVDKLECRLPFCIFVRENKYYQKIFLDDSFSTMIVEKLVTRSFKNYYDYVSKHSGLSEYEFRALMTFQASGCLALIKMSIKDDPKKWNCVNGCIDKFVKSGIMNTVDLIDLRSKKSNADR